MAFRRRKKIFQPVHYSQPTSLHPCASLKDPYAEVGDVGNHGNVVDDAFQICGVQNHGIVAGAGYCGCGGVFQSFRANRLMSWWCDGAPCHDFGNVGGFLHMWDTGGLWNLLAKDRLQRSWSCLWSTIHSDAKLCFYSNNPMNLGHSLSKGM